VDYPDHTKELLEYILERHSHPALFIHTAEKV
jgi:hypothetical protein